MVNLETVKATFEKIEADYARSVSEAQAEKDKAEKEVAECQEELQNTLKSADPKRYVETKRRLQDAAAIVEYYGSRISLANERRNAAVMNMLPALKQAYSDAIKEYKAACQLCIDKIGELKEASDKAGEIARNYNIVVSFFLTNVSQGDYLERQNTISNYAPVEFPNGNAFNLTKNLQFALGEMKRFIETY